MIAAAAMKNDAGLIFSLPRPNRHHDIIHALVGEEVIPHSFEQGFVTDKGEFVDRVEALKIALECKQPMPRGKSGGNIRLYSEDLW